MSTPDEKSMPRFEHIMWATDFGATSMDELAFVRALADHLGARMTVAHFSPSARGLGVGCEEMLHLLWRLPTSVGRSDVRHPVEGILDVARDSHVDLMILGVSPPHAPRWADAATVPDAVLRQSRTPVLRLPYASGHGIQNILVAVDAESPLAPGELLHAALIARACGGRITVVHVVAASESKESRSLLEASLRDLCGHYLADIESDCKLVQAPTVPDGILSEGAQGADLIVMATHARSGIDRLLHQSKTQEVATGWHGSLLAVPCNACTAWLPRVGMAADRKPHPQTPIKLVCTAH